MSATTIARRLGAPPRLEAILEGEALVNDGTGLTAYKIALGAAGAATVPAGPAVIEFMLVAAGGMFIGVAVGWIAAHLRIAAHEPSIDVVLSVLTPFAAYVPAEKVGASGVLAVVTAGVYVGTRSQELANAGARLRTLAFWQSSEFLLNSLLFLLIGLQVTRIFGDIEGATFGTLAGQAALVAAVAIGVRFAWMFVVPEIADLSVIGRSYTNRRERIVLAWSGMRGAVSLAAALAIPLDAFPERDLVIFLAYGAVLITLVLPGLTLAPLIGALGLSQSADAAAKRSRPRSPDDAASSGSTRWPSTGRRTSPWTVCATATSPASTGCATGWRAPADIRTTEPTPPRPRSRRSTTSATSCARCAGNGPSPPICCDRSRPSSTSTRLASARAAADARPNLATYVP